MARDSAAVAALDDRRRRRCPISTASNTPLDDASSLMTNGMVTSGSSSNDDVGVGDGGSSPKSSSAASTSTGGGSSSGSSRSGSDDDDSGMAVVRSSSTIDRSCPTAANALPMPPPLHKDDVVVDNSGDKESSSCSNSNDAVTNDTSTSIGGRLTFYKDGQFIFQLAAHHQKQSYNNQSATTTPCRWIPVPTVLQQHKNNIKSIGDWSHHQQNKTIWPYLVTSPVSESKSPQPVQQSQPSVVKIGERKQQQYQPRITPPPLTPISGPVNVASCTTAVVMATTTNIVRRPSRKCSITLLAENTTDGQNQNWQLQSQSRSLSKRLQPYQHQSFMMVVTKEIKAQRRLLSLPNKQRRRCRKTSTAVVRESLSLEKQPPHINLECVVRNLWCRRHTTELLMRRQLSINNSVDSVAAITAVDTAPALRHVVATTTSSVDSTFSSIMAGNGKRRSMFFPLPATDLTIPTSASAMITNSMGIIGSSSPSKKYRLGQQQQFSAVDKSVKKPMPCPSLAPVQASNNDHSITAILSGGPAGTKRAANSSGVVDSENCTITSATSSTTTSAAVTSQKMSPLSCSAPLSLLRTLLKSPGGEIGPSPVVASTTNGAGGGGYKHHQSGRKRSAAVESTAVAPLIPPPITVDSDPCRPPTVMASPSASGAGMVNDAAAAALTALHQLPVLHHPSTVAAAGQLAAAGYFNVLYHQAAMAAAMAYQTHAQLPKSQPLISSQFPAPAGNSWQRQLNCRRPSAVVPTTEAITGTGVAAVVASSASTVVAPYSSPLVTVGVNGGGGLLPPTTPSPPPHPLPLHPQPVRHHHLLLHQQPQYQPVPTIQKPPSSFHQHTKRRPLQGSSGVKQRMAMTATGLVAEYGDRVDGKSVGAVDVESSASADCVPLNLSKDSVTENVGDTSTTAKVR